MRFVAAALALAATSLSSAQTPAERMSFDVASLRPSARAAGRDARGPFTITPTGLRARNVSLRDLIADAWRVEPWQISGGPGWLDGDEFDVEAKTERPAAADQLAAMLRDLVTTRFRLALHREAAETHGYALVVSQSGSRLRPADSTADERIPATGLGQFRADMRRFASFLSVQLSIPAPVDPARPAIAADNPVPVIDRTGLAGTYDFEVELPPEMGADPFVAWRRALNEQLGLSLEPRRIPYERLVIDHADRTPAANE